ncbi:MAG: uracil-DNA glycosylase [Opitutales bacterium]|nr:uracil-DNA glycosylase [Opitutales bacterium]
MREELEQLLTGIRDLKKSGLDSLHIQESTLTEFENALKSVQAESAPTSPDKRAVKQAPVVETTTEKDLTSEPEIKVPEFTIPEGSKQEKWEWLRDRVLNCEKCNSHVKPGKKVVFGVGNIDADIFFCGEAPGQEEEIQGEPFVGPAGQLLTKIIQTTGLQRSDVYIGNIMNWRPETDTPYGNRPPTQEEMAYCLPYLKAQVEIVQPKLIVALGATAVNGLLGYDRSRSITKCRGNWYEFAGTPTIITFHPSYVLRNGSMQIKRQIWEDMLSVMEKLSMSISDKQRAFFTK